MQDFLSSQIFVGTIMIISALADYPQARQSLKNTEGLNFTTWLLRPILSFYFSYVLLSFLCCFRIACALLFAAKSKLERPDRITLCLLTPARRVTGSDIPHRINSLSYMARQAFPAP